MKQIGAYLNRRRPNRTETAPELLSNRIESWAVEATEIQGKLNQNRYLVTCN